jgi:hypothetical protein
LFEQVIFTKGNAMPTRIHCDELLEVIDVMEAGLRAPLVDISGEHLNHSFAEHKMSIGQIAVHTMGWPQYFMADENNKPWERGSSVPDFWTCMPCEYPLTPDFVSGVIEKGCQAMRDKLHSINDDLLEVTSDNEKGPGYILCRLQLHTMVHANQMSFLRQILDPGWRFGGHFGEMATAYIKISYHTSKDKSIGGF